MDVPFMPAGSEFAPQWGLDPEICFLNHGSFGACPTVVQAYQSELRARLERNPMDFMLRQLPGLAREAIGALAGLVGADPAGLALVSNATTGVNSVLRSLPLKRGDQIIVLNHGYAACENAVRFVADRAGARVVVADIPFPIQSPDQAVEAILSAVTDRTVLAVVDHITSPTGLVLPMAEIVTGLRERGVETLVDGAHVPGQLPLDLQALGAAYYTGNCHKWLCTPKGSAFLYVRQDKREQVRPAVISHGATADLNVRFRREFDWQGTLDPTPWLCIPTAIKLLSGLFEDGLSGLQRRNHALALRARDGLCATLNQSPPAPDQMLGSLAAVRLPDGAAVAPSEHLLQSPLQNTLWTKHKIEVPVVYWPERATRWIRISAAAYNAPGQYDYLLSALAEELG